MIHVRKVAPEYFEALLSGKKRFEIRREEPGEEKFAVGDYLGLNEYDNGGSHTERHSRFTGRCLLFRITYILRGHELLKDGTAILGLQLMPLSFDDVPGAAALQPGKIWTL